MDSPTYTRYQWAKSDRKWPQRIHLLEHHLADVGACFNALLHLTTVRKRLATAGGLGDLDEATVARLSVLAALHDIGKANTGFQTQIWPDDLLKGSRRPGRAGHYRELAPVLTGSDWITAEWFFDSLGWWHEATETWDECGGETVCALLVATLSHHGRPLQLEGGLSENPAIWRPFGHLNPEECVRRIGNLLRRWFPSAFVQGGLPLPSAPAFQHMFLGLCNWADWIGSDERIFKYCEHPRDDYIDMAIDRARQAIQALGLDLTEQRREFGRVPKFGNLFDINGEANAIQAATRDEPIDRPLVIVESETGSGKTEAALWRFARMYEAGLVDGLYFALPTRSAAVQIHQRVERFAHKLLLEMTPSVVLAVPGYAPSLTSSDIAMGTYDSLSAGHTEDQDIPWASENPKRFLAAQIAVGTVDQAMMGALQMKNAHMRAACLARNLLVVDEVHASDTYMSVVLEALIDAHIGAGGYALLMSATLGSVARHRWLNYGRRMTDFPNLDEAICAPYPSISAQSGKGEKITSAGENDQQKTVTLEASPTMQDFEGTADRALAAARAGAKVLVVRNTVDYAVRTQQALEAQSNHADKVLLFTANALPTLHHGRFAGCDRRLLDSRVEALLGKPREHGGLVVVGTQTLEQSLDIDADLLITDLCPVDVLLQRIGRLHRHNGNARPDGYRSPKCIVLTQPDGLEPLLSDGTNANGLGPRGFVYRDLRILEATQRLVSEHEEWRIPEMNRRLVEKATHPDALKGIVDEMGENWQADAIDVEGIEMADRQLARGHIIRRDKSFFTDNREVLFVSEEANIRTRLGEDRMDIALDPPQPSPFDALYKIDKLAISIRWLGNEDVPMSTPPSHIDGGFEFTIGNRMFRYDRLGLHPE